MAMNEDGIKQLAKKLLGGEISIEAFAGRVASENSGVADIGSAQLDIGRSRRCGFPEVIFAEGKTIGDLRRIVSAMLEHDIEVFATRMSCEQAASLKEEFPAAIYNPVARTFRVPKNNEPDDIEEPRGRVAIVTAGTSDLPVAEEARETALWTGASVEFVQDVGVAGPHRLTANLPILRRADAVVVVAGMEGALPSVVGGHVSCPVIAVPTSVGYGASFGGVAALLGMLNSCASNVTVVNIDAGFKGGYVAGLIARNVRHGERVDDR